MRFEYFHDGLRDQPKLSVDGLVENSLHFSHWKGNETPGDVKADTSTEIALNVIASPNRNKLTGGIELVTNNHFDTDGVLSVWTMLNPSQAGEFREQLIAAAEAGDFSEFSNEAGVKASLVIQGSDDPDPSAPSGSPLGRELSGGKALTDADLYELILPKIPEVLTHIDNFERLWREPWQRIERALDSFSRDASLVVEDDEQAVSLVLLDPAVSGSSGFKPTRHSAPFTAISNYTNGRFFVVATAVGEQWSYRLDYPYYSWAETVTRPPILRRDLLPLLERLNEMEESLAGRWLADDNEMTSAAKFLDLSGEMSASSLKPEIVAAEVRKIFIDK